jgi:hypothetical protein
LRRVRLGKNSDLLEPLRKAGYYLEDDQMDKENTMVVEIPVTLG